MTAKILAKTAILTLLCAASNAWGADASWSAGDGVTPDRACTPWSRGGSSVQTPAIAGGVMSTDTSSGALHYTHSSLVTEITYPIEIEFKTRYVSGTINHASYSHIQVFVATAPERANTLHISNDEVFLWSAAPGLGVKGDTAFVDTTGALHTYKMTIQANGDIDVYYDGGATPLISGVIFDYPNVANTSFLWWGDGTSLASGAAEWEYFKHNMHATGCPPNPPTDWDAADDLRPDEICPPWMMLEKANIPAVSAPEISGGVMTISTSTTELDKSLFFQQESPLIQVNYPIVAEFRARYVSGESPDNNPDYSHMQVVVTTPTEGAVLQIAEDEVFLWSEPGVKGDVAFPDTDDAMHTYRLEIEASGAVSVFYDAGASPLLTGSLMTDLTGGIPLVYWGDSTTTSGGISEWEFFEHNLLAETVDSDGDGTLNSCDRDDGLIHLFFQFKEIPAWYQELGFDSWNLYKGDLDELFASTTYTQLPGSNVLADQECNLPNTSWEDTAPAPGKTAFYLVSGVLAGVEGSLGTNGDSVERPNDNPCP